LRQLLFTSLVTLAVTHLVGTTSAHAQYAAAVLADAPVAYYRLGEGPGSTIAIDLALFANHGIYQRTPILGVPGLVNDTDTAVDCRNGEVYIPDAPHINFISQPFTIEAWINGNLVTPTNTRVFDKADAGTGHGYALDLNMNFGTPNVRLTGSTNLQVLLPAPLPSNTTHHLVAVADGMGTARIYVNGVLAGSGSYTNSLSYTGAAHIGVANDGTAHTDSVIDEVALYNHALSAERVLAHYQAGTGTGAPPLLVQIDIKPGSFPNAINIGSSGTVPVAILSSSTFDALTVDPTTISLASAPVRLKGKGQPMASAVDVNNDGRPDLIVHVSTEALLLTSSDTEAVLEGRTYSGQSIRGSDSIRVVP
jgi:hypothetical protein